MRKVVAWTSVYGRDAERFGLMVNALIQKGWQPFGSVAFCPEAGGSFCQGMVKYEE